MKRIVYGVCLMLSLHTHAQVFSDQSSLLPAGATSASSMDVAAADLDDDGDPDIVLAMEYSRNVILFNDGNGQFAVDPDKILPDYNPNDSWTGEDSEDIAIADFDQDGDLDLLFVSEDTPNHELMWNDGTGKFTFANYQFPTSTANGLAVIDLNADDYPDVIIGNNGQNRVYINQTDGTFQDETADRFPVNTDQTQDLKLADIDGDLDLDLIEGVEVGGNNIYLSENGVFSLTNDRLPEFGALLETRKVVPGDIDLDGDMDLFYCNVAWEVGANPSNRLLLNDGQGYFTDVSDTHLPPNASFTLDALFLDLNGDEKPELVTTGLGNPGTTHKAYFNNGTGIFSEGTPAILPPLSIETGIGLLAEDLNLDGQIDIYWSNFQASDNLTYRELPDNTQEKKTEKSIAWEARPHPLENTLVVHFEHTLSLDASLALFSITGQPLASWTIPAGSQDFSIEIKKKWRGAYVFSLTVPDHLISSKVVHMY